MYERMAKDAEEEGFPELAAQFRGVGAIEKLHEEAGDVLILLELLNILEDGTTAHNPKWERWAKRIRESKHTEGSA